jgi:GNAT superfamily N-acetyltransferase
MPRPPELAIRSATAQDARLLLELIREFAEHVKLLSAVVVTEERLRSTLFGPEPCAEVLLAFLGEEPVGFAVFFPTYSTFLGQPGIYLEDLFVRPAFRGRGIGRLLLARVAKTAADRKCGRLEWSALDWNEAAIGFYLSLGAEAKIESTVYRLAGEELSRLAEAAGSATG